MTTARLSSILFPQYNILWREAQQKFISWQLGLAEVFEPFLWAAPKKKTSHSKKRMRSANKGLKDKTNIVNS
ncbi:3152_t:CDS:2 [Gigaspora rosea]|nr:3152_t:CDS:2 [Gigaspora rosea]